MRNWVALEMPNRASGTGADGGNVRPGRQQELEIIMTKIVLVLRFAERATSAACALRAAPHQKRDTKTCPRRHPSGRSSPKFQHYFGLTREWEVEEDLRRL